MPSLDETRKSQNLDAHRKRVLITVKAYPLLSRSYSELVCTAGVLAGILNMCGCW